MTQKKQRSSFSPNDTRTFIPRVEVENMLYKQFKDLSEMFQASVKQDHLNILHRLVNEDLTYDDVVLSMNKYGVDLETEYFNLLGTLEDAEKEDE